MPTIVLASDAPSVRNDIVSILADEQTRIVEVTSGFAVRDAVAEHEPDLVISDMQMGNMGGMAVCVDLHLEASYGNLPQVPVLLLLDRRADVFLARRAEAEGFLVKPLDPIRVRRAVRALLDGGTFYDDSFQPRPVTSSAPIGAAAPAPS